MKVVLLAAGLGNRLKPITNTIPKSMICIGGRPFLEYIINDLTSLGFDEICLVVGYQAHQIKEYFGNGRKFNAKIKYVIQNKYKGTADATNHAKKFVADDEFLLYLSDTIIPNDLADHIKNMMKCEDSNMDILTAVIPSSKIVNAGNVEVRDNYVVKIKEKSTGSKSNLGWAGIAFFKDHYIFKMIENLPPSASGEYDITEAMDMALSNKKKIKNHICERYVDCGTKEGLIEALKFILTHKPFASSSYSKSETNSFIIEPAYIGKNCLIGINTTIGPNVSIGDNVKVGDNVRIEESIILQGSSINENQTVYRSIISQDGDLI